MTDKNEPGSGSSPADDWADAHKRGAVPATR